MTEFNQNLGDLKISGAGNAGGGEFNNVSISGSGRINGDLKCDNFKISGSGSVDGSVVTSKFKISGSGKIKDNLRCMDGCISGSGKVLGNVEGGKFDISGAGTIGGSFKGDEFNASGAGKIGAGISATKVKIMGAVSVGGDIEGEDVDLRGAVRVKGMINADSLNIQVDGKVEADEIGATKVNVVRGSSYMGVVGKLICSLFVGSNVGYLTVNTIEADDIYLENTIAEVVRGNRIIIGSGCKIKKVEYREKLEKRDNNSVVESETRM